MSIAKRYEGGREQEYWAWPHFRIKVAGSPEYNAKFSLKFIGTVEELKFETILLGKYGSLPSSRASSYTCIPGLDKPALSAESFRTLQSLPGKILKSDCSM